MAETTRTLKEIVCDYLTEYPALRDNDNMLIARIVKDIYGITNLYDMALLTNNNIYSTITRYRAKVQRENPMLESSEKVRIARERYEEKIREEMQGV